MEIVVYEKSMNVDVQNMSAYMKDCSNVCG